MGQKELLKNVKRDLTTHLRITKMFLFGSRARGDYHHESDYDLAIISPDFEGLSPINRYKIVDPIVRKSLGAAPIDLACYTPQEYTLGKKRFLPKIIEEEGIMI